jgi:putative transport protein
MRDTGKRVLRLLAESELLLLFVVVGVGLVLGRIGFRGIRLGVAGVLFAGIAISWSLGNTLRPLHVAPQIRDLGLVLFVYCVGLWSGPGFFRAFRGNAARLNAIGGATLLLGAAIALLGGWLLGLERGYIAGVFSGALTNTPSLAAAADRLKGTAFSAQPALAYSVTYPFGVLGAILLFRFAAGVGGKRSSDEAASSGASELQSSSFIVTRDAIAGHAVGELRVRQDVGVVLSRLRRSGKILIPNRYTVLAKGDVVTAVGTRGALEQAAEFFGAVSSERLEYERGAVDTRRVLVSSKEHVGRSLQELALHERFNAQVTRLRRADLDLLPSSEMRLELGDRLRIVAPVERLGEVSRFFGDSERALAQVDFFALAVGLTMGLLLARVPIPIPGGELKLGTAGGPLLVALVLGRLGRSGSLLWSIPYEASSALRDLGLLLFLAGVGVGAGNALGNVVGTTGMRVFALGVVVTIATTSAALFLLRRFGRTDAVEALGATSGMQTQPATLAFAYELSGRSESIYVAYAVVYPIAMIGKIVLAQTLALFG